MKEGLGRLKRWWSNKYKRPPTDPLFENQTAAELRLEMYEDLLAQREEILERMEGESDMRERRDLHERLSKINGMFGFAPDQGQDDLIDEWERDLAEGRVPDLTKKTVG
ncbi:MAG: hypothetical protein A2Y61_00225 [Chloroflexi bacterium RBG_13_60_13]|nr:MAG: hypothetical protein A2Y61_00225 [Chloroflexi bacterium RBG_13_60_13]